MMSMFSEKSDEQLVEIPWKYLLSVYGSASHWFVSKPTSDLIKGPSFTRSNSFYVDEDNNLQKAIHESLQSQHLSNIHVAHDSFQSSADDHSTKASSWTKNLQTVPKQEQTQTEIQRQDAYVEKCYGLYRFRIIPDGNCLYRAISQALVSDQSKHMVIRKEVVHHIQNNLKDYTMVIEGDPDMFLKEASKENVWGSYTEILAITQLFDINVVIITGGTDRDKEVHVTCHHFDPDSEAIVPRDTVWLSWLSNGHYDVILKRPYPNPHYDAWLESVSKRMERDQQMAEQLALEDLQFQKSDAGMKSNANERRCFIPSRFDSGSSVDPPQQRHTNSWTVDSDEQLARSLQEEEAFAACADEYV